MKATLRDMEVGEKGKVAGFVKGKTAYRERILAMGLTRGTEFTVEHIAPLGDPVGIIVRGFALSLRKDEASAIMVERGKI